MRQERAFAARDGETLECVAAQLGVTRERVRQIEVKALQKCRAWCEERGLRFEDLAIGQHRAPMLSDGCRRKRMGPEQG